MEEGGEGGKRKGGDTETEGRGSQEGARGKIGGETLSRGGSCRKKSQRSDTETDAGRGAEPSQSRYKKGHMTNMYLTELDEEAIVDFVKDLKE